MINALTYDLEILEAAVLEKRMSGRAYYLSPEELSQNNLDYQNQCRIYEQVLDFGFDREKVPLEFRG
jgi:hypothetical protein